MAPATWTGTGTNRVLKQTPETIQCSGSSCNASQCCDDITDKCSNNTDTTQNPDIQCNVLGKYELNV